MSLYKQTLIKKGDLNNDPWKKIIHNSDYFYNCCGSSNIR